MLAHSSYPVMGESRPLTATGSTMNSMQSQVPSDFSIGFGTEIEEEVFNGPPLVLLLAVVALITVYVVRRRRNAGKKR